MNTLTIVNPALTASPTPAGAPPAAADPGDTGDGDLDFAGLLGAGIGRTTDPAQASESVEIKEDAMTKDAGGDTPVCDPAALLDAIAAGKGSIEPPQVSAAQVVPQPIPASLTPLDPTELARRSDPATLTVTAHDSSLFARKRAELSRSTHQSDTQETANALRPTDAPHDSDAGPAVTVAQAAQHEPIAVPVFKAELSERRLESASPQATVGSTPNQALALALAPSQSANAASVVAHVEHLAQPFGSPAWDDGFSSRVVWMAANDVQSAEIRLNPPNLGPIEVKLVLTNDQGAQASASVQFSAAHAATREAIESALPRLREMLLDNGIALGNTTVDARTAGNSNGSGDSGRPSPGGTQSLPNTGQTPEPANPTRPGSPLHRGNGLVDTFA